MTPVPGRRRRLRTRLLGAKRRVAAALAALLVPGCATFRGHEGTVELTLPGDPERPTELDSRLDREAAGRPDGTSGVALLATGENSLLARFALADLAARSLDIQTYIWELDGTGREALSRVLAAADRGTRVRVLLDDTSTFRSERAFVALDRHPNVEVRFFNPFRTRGQQGVVRRLLELLVDFRRLHRRMHVKSWIADGGFAIVGGRNVADEYFLASPELNFRDLDLLIAGPAAEQTSIAFDRHWNSRWSVPVLRLSSKSTARLDRLRRRLARQGDVAMVAERDFEAARRALGEAAPELVWAPVDVLVDPPEKLESNEPSAIALRLVEETERLTASLDVEIAYLVLPEAGTELLERLALRGIAVRILTNSLATTDVIAAHAGYAGSRRRLIEAGAELHELRPGAHVPGRHLRPPIRSRASLHSKAAVFDRERVFVGSLNLDARSILWNTEIGVFVESREIAARLSSTLEQAFALERSWRLQLRPRRVRSGGHDLVVPELVWVGPGDHGAPEVRTHEPRSSVWRRLTARWLSWLPLDDLL